MARVCSICARAGSQGVVGKNKRLIAGQPLYAHTIEHALKSGFFDWVVVSSDDPVIREGALEQGVSQVVVRPEEMATSTAGKLPAIHHAIQLAEAESGLRFSTMVDLDVTSPLRLIEDIHGAVSLLEDDMSVTNVITGHPAHRSPYFNLVESDDAGFVALSKSSDDKVLRRQDAPECFDMNASIYVWRRESFFPMPKVFDTGTRIFEMPPERGVDIDSELDFEIVEFLMSKSLKG